MIKTFLKSEMNRKKLLKILWFICALVFIILFIRYKTYKQAIIYYNKGIKHFKQQEFGDAESYFKNAIWEKHTKKQECKMRINLALSITTPITPESVTPDNLDENIARLEMARDYLTVNDCAHENDSNGHSVKAQILKEEIDAYIEQLKKQCEQMEEEEKKDEPQEDDKKEEDEKERQMQQKKQELKKEFEKLEQAGLDERTQTLPEYKEWGNYEFSYGNGGNW